MLSIGSKALRILHESDVSGQLHASPHLPQGEDSMVVSILNWRLV